MTAADFAAEILHFTICPKLPESVEPHVPGSAASDLGGVPIRLPLSGKVGGKVGSMLAVSYRAFQVIDYKTQVSGKVGGISCG